MYWNKLTQSSPPASCSTIHLQSIVHRRSQSGKMNTKPGACRWSSHLSVSTPLPMVNFAIFLPLLHPPHYLPLFMVHFFLWPPSPNYQWFHIHSFAVQPFDHNAIACFPDLMPSLWSILCGPRTFCVTVRFLPDTFLMNQLCYKCPCGHIVYLQYFGLGKCYCHELNVKWEFVSWCVQ